MLNFAQIMGRLLVAMILGSLMGLERELAGKEAGIRTEMLVSGGSALFTLAALSIPYVVSPTPEVAHLMMVSNAGFLSIIGNIVVGIGFLGAGIIMKTTEHIHGLTTAAFVWTTAAIGILCGLGLMGIATAATILIAGVLYLMRHLNVTERIDAARD